MSRPRRSRTFTRIMSGNDFGIAVSPFR
jgi:hypothetical protein